MPHRLAYNQIDGGNSSAEVPSSTMALACIELIKINQYLLLSSVLDNVQFISKYAYFRLPMYCVDT